MTKKRENLDRFSRLFYAKIQSWEDKEIRRQGRHANRRFRALLFFFVVISMSYAYYNPNPAGRRSVGDCTVRALSKALGQTWEETYVGLALEGFTRGDLPNADSVWGPYLKAQGFTRHWMPDECPDCYTVADFAADHPQGTFILSVPGRHVVAVVGGQYFDSWDSGKEAPAYYWVKES